MRRNPLLLVLLILGATLRLAPAVWGQDARAQHGPAPLQSSSPPVLQGAEARPSDLRRQADEMRDLANFLRNIGKQEVADQLRENAEQLVRQAEQLESDHAGPRPAAETTIPNEHFGLLSGDADQTPDKGLDGIGWGICEKPRNPVFDGPGVLGFEAHDKSALSDQSGQLPGLSATAPPGGLADPLWFPPPSRAARAASPTADVWEESRPAPPCVAVPVAPLLESPDVCVPKATPLPELPGVAVPPRPPVAGLPSLCVPPSPSAADGFQPTPCPVFRRGMPPAGSDRLQHAAWHLRQAAAELQTAGHLEDADTLRAKAERLQRQAGPHDSVESLRREVAGLKRQVIDLTRSLEAMHAEVRVLTGRLERAHRLQ